MFVWSLLLVTGLDSVLFEFEFALFRFFFFRTDLFVYLLTFCFVPRVVV